jgi:hypothetical protein
MVSDISVLRLGFLLFLLLFLFLRRLSFSRQYHTKQRIYSLRSIPSVIDKPYQGFRLLLMKSSNQFGEIIPNCALVVELDDLSIDSINNIDHLRQ